MDKVLAASTALLLGFVVLSCFDGVHRRRWRHRPWARPASRREHGLHPVRAARLVPGVLLVLATPTAGIVLRAGVLVLIIDQVVAVLDILEERASRAGLGGPSAGESLVQAVLVTRRVAPAPAPGAP